MDSKTKKILYLVGTILAAIATALVGLTSCGVTKAYIRNAHEGAQTTITITSNPTQSVSIDGNTLDADVLNKPAN